MDKIIWADEIEKILAEHFGCDPNDVCLHVMDGMRVVAVLPEDMREKDD